MAGKVADATWPLLTQCWNPAADPADAEVIASGIDATKDVIHSSLLSWPVATLGGIAGLPVPFVSVAADMAGAKSLPGDKPLGTASDAIRITGIAIGLATGQPALVLASVKSLAAHQFTRVVQQPVMKL